MTKYDVYYKKQKIDTVEAENYDDAIDIVVRNLDDWDAFDVTDADEQQDSLNEKLDDMNVEEGED